MTLEESKESLMAELVEILNFRNRQGYGLPEGVSIQRFSYLKERLGKLLVTYPDYIWALEEIQPLIRGVNGWGFQLIEAALASAKTDIEAQTLYGLEIFRRSSKLRKLVAQKMLEIHTDVGKLKAFFASYLEES